MNKIVESQNLEESSLAVRRMLTETGDLFQRGQFEGTGKSSVIRQYD